MNNSPIGVFDSGVGGLTVLKELADLMPNETYIYIGDNCHSPYGDKSRQELLAYTTDILSYFQTQGTDLVVMACNTTSSLVLEELRLRFDKMTIIGVIDATVEKVSQTQKERVLVMATAATIASGVYQQKIGASSYGLACPKLVPLIEQAAPQAMIEAYLKTLLGPLQGQFDQIVLGSTQYPIIQHMIGHLYPGAQLISSSEAVAHAVYQYCLQANRIASKKTARSKIYTTGALESFVLSSRSFFDYRGYDVRYLPPLTK